MFHVIVNSTKISIPILKVLEYHKFLKKNRSFNSCDHVMLAFEVTKHNVIISINHLQKYCFILRYFKSRSTQNCIEIVSKSG